MRVLLLEDKNDISNEIKKQLILNGHDTKILNGIAQAQQYLTLNKDEKFDAFIFDINMPAKCLFDDKLIELSDGGLFTGWIWFYHLQYLKNKEKYTNIKLIMYSRFVNDMNDYFLKVNKTEEEDFFRNDVFPVVKGNGNVKTILSYLKGENDVQY